MDATLKFGVWTGCALAGLATAACGGPETGMPVPSSIVKVALTATSTNEEAVAVRSDSALLSVEEVGLSLRALELVPCASEAASIAHENYPVDLADEPPASADFESGVSDYCALGVEIAP
jgi:hypothetical protein